MVYPSVLAGLGFEFKDVTVDTARDAPTNVCAVIICLAQERHHKNTFLCRAKLQSLLDTDRVLSRNELLGLLEELKEDVCAEVCLNKSFHRTLCCALRFFFHCD